MFRLLLFFLFTPEFPIGLLVFCSHLCPRSWHSIRESAILLPRGSAGKCTQLEPKHTLSADGTSICISSGTAGWRNAPWLLADCRCRHVNIELTCSLWLTMKQKKCVWYCHRMHRSRYLVSFHAVQVFWKAAFTEHPGILGMFRAKIWGPLSGYAWRPELARHALLIEPSFWDKRSGKGDHFVGVQRQQEEKKKIKKINTQKKGDITCPSLPTFLCVQTTCTFLSFTVESLCVLLKTIKGGWRFKK